MIEVLFFAGLKEEAGMASMQVDAIGMTVEEMCEKYLVKLNLPSLDKAMTAINEEYAPGSAVLNSGDVVAFIPPVSGG
ncbi:molybdopterin converting factor subunit 1 [Aciduricibacillus chroicocephali]|uniref:Molybdopterin synthase sulfur carrier subunit n=1 Tax=Aciduricibacillus chroicocephali TaxID=3054939 RepID=A0ABY9KXZ3_9BACI|nr:molybdopterin converting factor subunit 1 [Bacillaceae bacterium 44XB]